MRRPYPNYIKNSTVVKAYLTAENARKAKRLARPKPVSEWIRQLVEDAIAKSESETQELMK